MVFPIIQFILQAAGLTIEEEDEMSDIQFLAVKEFDGKLVHAEVNQASTGDGATLTAASGKDLIACASRD